MESESLQPQIDKMNRRQLLGRGTVLIGGALAGSGLQTRNALGQEKARTGEASSKPEAENAKPAEAANLHPPVAQTNGGKLRGFRDGKTYTFLGVPYAVADRFEPPKPVKPWDGIKSAQVWGSISPVPFDNVPRTYFVMPHMFWPQSEHCQVLNVWTQNLGSQAKKPVMVWFHGGGFTNGASNDFYAYDGKNLSEFGDVVVVSMNHRLNILGTLDLSAYGPEYENSRYTGTADLVAAVQWVHDNIENFGGDPANVTLFGQSGGGSKAVRMMHTPAAKGLFNKVIAQSGGNLTYRDTDPATSIKTQQMIAASTLKNLSLDGRQIDKLKKIPYEELIDAGNAALQSVAKELGHQGLGWDVIADDKYVMREFCDWADSIPLMAGTVFSENVGTAGIVFNPTAGAMIDGGKNEWSKLEIDEHLTAAYGDKKTEVVVEFQKNFPRKKVQDVLYYATSRSGVKDLLGRKLERGKTPVWNYLFAYEYPVDGGITSFHMSEIVFAFHNVGQPQSRIGTGGTQAALALQDKVARAWINFAKTGNPGQPGLEWKAYTPQDSQAMVFDTVSEAYPLRDDKLISLMTPHA